MLDADILAESAALLHQLRAAGLTLATAESCTGGLIAAALTHHAGSSDVFGWGFVSYANEAKAGLLGVPMALIAEHGAVSQPVAAAMAEGAASRAGASLAVAVTGIAGPGGGSAEKPVGLVWFGLARAGHAAQTEHRVFPGDRAAVRAATVRHALGLVRTLAG